MATAYFLSHNGLGDNISNIGAVRYLLKYYDTIFFLCKDIYVKNVCKLFNGLPVVIVPIDSKNEFADCFRIINNSKDSDRFISGCHKSYLSFRIRSPDILDHVPNHIPLQYDHIEMFYKDIGLDTSIYIHYFDIESTEESVTMYDKIKDLHIVFLHTKGSNRTICVDETVQMYKDQLNYIIICANDTVYPIDHPYYTISKKYVNIPIVDYIDVIKHASIIEVIDSCFACIIYPLQLAGKLSTENIRIREGLISKGI
jgi:hypothetical protein